jgi:ABC-2 type transport system permease protein
MLSSLNQATDEWIFASEGAPGADDPLSDKSEITKGLQQVLFLYAGTIKPIDDTGLSYVELATTGENAGTISNQRLSDAERQGIDNPNRLRMLQGEPKGRQVVAAYVEGTPKSGLDAPKTEEGKAKGESNKPIRVAYVSDADCLAQVFVDIRNSPEQYEEFNFRLQNVTFVLNVIDVLADEIDYPAVRRHTPQHTTLRLVEDMSQSAREEEANKREEYRTSFDQARQNAEADATKNIQEFQERVQKLQKTSGTDPTKQREIVDALQQLRIKQDNQNRKVQVEIQKLERERDRKVSDARRVADLQIRGIQNQCKALAVFIPPIPPLLVGISVFMSRRLREREGISKSRLR